MRSRTKRAGAVGALLGAMVAIAVATAPAALAGTSPPVGTAAVGGPYATSSHVSRTATTGGVVTVGDRFVCAACAAKYGPVQLPEPEPVAELYAGSNKHSIMLSGMHFSTQSYARVKLDIWTYAGHRHVYWEQVSNDFTPPMMKNGSFRITTWVPTCYGDPDAYAVARDEVTGFTADPVTVRVGPC